MGRSGKRRKKGKGSRKGSGDPLLTREQQRDLLGVGLVVLALFVLLALVPVAVFGERGVEWFPRGNAMGIVGVGVRHGLAAAFGWAAALVPVTLLLAGLYAGEWGPATLVGRLALFATGLLLLLPAGLHVVAPDPASGGWVGEVVGGSLMGWVSWLGALLVLLAAVVALSVLVLRWNPLRTVGQGVAVGGGAVGRSLQGAGRRMGEWWASRPGPGSGGPPEDAGSEGDAAAEEPSLWEPQPMDPDEEPDPGTEAVPAATTLPARSDAAPAPADPFPDPAAGRSHEDDDVPVLDLLDPEPESRRDMDAELDRLGRVLVEKLRTFNVESELGGRTTGPVVTQFEVVPAAGVKVNRIANLDADLALAMRAPSIRIVAPIPGKGAVGVEIPNPEPEIVHLRAILEAPEYQRARGQLPLGLGKDLRGRPYVADLAKMPHLLIAGATGSGKSVCVNTIVTSLVYRHTPETLRLLMIDPKMVELSAYADLPHLRHPVVTDPSEAAGVLKWAVLEMERRYQLLSANGVRSIAEFNRRVRDDVVLRRPEAQGEEGDEDRWIYDDGVLPYIVVVVDELADLMMQVQSDVERPLAQLAQKARAIGIHLIVATQRPSVNVITGLIKANFPTRIAFRVASKTDSRTILDQNGAEALLGNGDMLFLPPGQSEPVRVQGAYIATEETDRLIAWYRTQEARRVEADGEDAATPGESDILEEVRASEQVDASEIIEETLEDRDEYFRAAAELCIQHDQGSTSLLQRKLRIGYGRAARIVDQLHEAGILGPPDGSKPREVLVGLDAVDLILSGMDEG